MYKEFRGKTNESDKVWEKLLTLPLYPDLTDFEQKFIIDILKEELE